MIYVWVILRNMSNKPLCHCLQNWLQIHQTYAFFHYAAKSCHLRNKSCSIFCFAQDDRPFCCQIFCKNKNIRRLPKYQQFLKIFYLILLVMYVHKKNYQIRQSCWGQLRAEAVSDKMTRLITRNGNVDLDQSTLTIVKRLDFKGSV